MARTPGDRVEAAADLMDGFAARTGLSGQGPQRRYLWTDAYAVGNWLELRRITGRPRHGEVALGLIDAVHGTLGRHRPDDVRRGWLSGLPEGKATQHPTLGGLRIGKELPERELTEPADERLEWERDGQYFHYLTRWMRTLDATSRSFGSPLYNLWARELAHVAHRAFTHGPPGQGSRRMYWKMSIDLTRPLVRTMGHHDPLDGLVTALQLKATAQAFPSRAVRRGIDAENGPSLDDAVADFDAMTEHRDWATPDPLGLGGLLVDVCRLHELSSDPHLRRPGLLAELQEAVLVSLRAYGASAELEYPADARLAFRELGLAIGLATAHRWAPRSDGPSAAAAWLGELQRSFDLGEQIVRFWSSPRHRTVSTWAEHRNINDVMFATALLAGAGP